MKRIVLLLSPIFVATGLILPIGSFASDAPAGLAPVVIDVPGIVTDTQGNPVAGADVSFVECKADAGGRFEDELELAKTKTDANGRFEMKGMKLTRHAIDYWVRATANGYAYGGAGLDTSGGKKFFDFERQCTTDEAWIILFPAEKIEGTIVDEQGNPVAGAKVFGIAREAATSGMDGSFSLDKAPVNFAGALISERRLTVSHPDFVEADLRSIAIDGPELVHGPQTIKLVHGVKISGRITDRDSGRGLAGISIWARVPWIFDQQFTTRTNANGQYVLRVPRPMQLRLEANVHPAKEIMSFDLNVENINGFDSPDADFKPVDEKRAIDLADADNSLTGVDFKFEPDRVLHGTIKMQDGSMPPESLTMQAFCVPENSHQLMGIGMSWRNIFRVGGLDAGTYEVRAIQYGYEGKPHVLAKQQVNVTDWPAPMEMVIPHIDIEALPPSPPKLHGTVRDAAGNPLKLAKINAGAGGDTFTDLNGGYELKQFDRHSSREIWAWNSTLDQAAIIENIDMPDMSLPFDIVLHPAAQISGVIHETNGDPLPDVGVALVEDRRVSNGIESATLVMCKSDSAGKYVINGVIKPTSGQDIRIQVQPHIDKPEHYNYTIASRAIPSDLAEGQKIDDYNFTVDLSQPLIKVTTDPPK